MFVISQLQKVISGAIKKTEQSIKIWANTSKTDAGTDYVPTVNSDGQWLVETISSGGAAGTDLVRVGGVTYQLGSSTATSAMSVVLATDARIKGMDKTTVINSETINPSSSFTTSAVTIESQRIFSIEYDMATSSHVSLAFTCSNNGTNFYVSEGYGNIGSYTAAGISEFTLPACMSFKVVATNIDASDLVLNGFIASDRT